MTQYLVYDVFTDKAFGGNQLAVFPDATQLPEESLQSITAEFNFSEVTFVFPPQNPARTARVRIFTPTSDIDFAGHPIIGTVRGLHLVEGYITPDVFGPACPIISSATKALSRRSCPKVLIGP